MNRLAAARSPLLVREAGPGDGHGAAGPWEVGYDLRTALGPLGDLADRDVPRIACLAVQATLVVLASDAIGPSEPPGDQRRAARELVAAAGSAGLRRATLRALRASRRLARSEDRRAAREVCAALRELAAVAPGPRSAAACTRLAFAVAARFRLDALARARAAHMARYAAAHGATRDAERWARWARPTDGG